MLQQILVISPNGPCLVEKAYQSLNVDSQLISGFLAAVLPHMKVLGYTLDSIHSEVIGDSNTYMEIYSQNNWICVGIATFNTDRIALHSILEEIETIITRDFGTYTDILDISVEQINNASDEIDMVISQRGIIVSVSSNNLENKAFFQEGEKGLLPIIQSVLDGKMSPDKAANTLIKSIKNEELTETDLKNMKSSLKLIDDLMSKQSKGKLDELIVLIRSIHQGVSQITIRMDDALNF